MAVINTIIFDLGNVLIDWRPEYVFDNKYFDSPEKKEYFFKNICTPDWNEEQDAGRSIVVATQDLVAKYPEWEQAIRDFYGRWTEMLGGPIAETVEMFRELKERKYKTYALTNWQAGLFDIALVRYNFLHWFDGRVVSGEEKIRKPFPEFYNRLLTRYNVKPDIKAARELGINSIHFTSPAELRRELVKLKILE
jgi:2-haloacid dehalogenase